MSKRKKIERIEEEIEEIEEETINNDIEGKKAARKEAIIVEEDLEKEMEERIKEREKKEKIIYEENRIKRFVREKRDDIRIYLIGFFIFLLIVIGLVAAFGLYVFLGVTTPELLLIICGGLGIAGVIILIYIGQNYLLKE